ncbi:MAG: glucosamine-6-phosphate deaminase [Candidatus Aminicenantes bacterium]|jgi:glucosamine-6-phosphate deaminase
METIIKNDYNQICSEAVDIIHRKWQRKNDLVLGLATGRTPLGVYAKLIDMNRRGTMDFSAVRAFNLDEYLGLNEDHPQSFARYMSKNFYSQINMQKENIHRLEGTPKNIDEHCRQFEETIKGVGGIDVQILGIGSNGHIGFNEPSSSLASRTRVKTLTADTIAANRSLFEEEKDIPRFCLTMGIGTIMEAKTILLLAFGQKKSEAIAKSIEGPVTASVPASVLQLHPEVKFIIDDEAASLLSKQDYYNWVYENKNKVDDYLKKT